MWAGALLQWILQWWPWFSHNRGKLWWGMGRSDDGMDEMVFGKEKTTLVSLGNLSTHFGSFTVFKFCHNLV